MISFKETASSARSVPGSAGHYAQARANWSALQGAERHAKALAGAADAEYRDCSCSAAEREAVWFAHRESHVIAIPPVLPNPSLKRSANGRPPGPGRWYAVHFHRPGPGGLPLAPA